ncbi:MAG: hypothetical protein EPN86_04015 [Nanoarchaeota archaeon]|nr:MAG: hypothetical protein EPN86_04015 [Nanoarchaeota archaeon]
MFGSKYKSIAIIGAGSIGKEIATVASNVSGLEQILITTPRNIENARIAARVVGTNTKSKAIAEEVYWDMGGEGFARIREETDVALIALNNSAQVSPNKALPHMDYLKPNLELIKEVARQFQGYQGLVVVVTNPTDILSYVFAQVSGLDPTQVVGFNHVDQTRGLSMMRDYWARNRTDRRKTSMPGFEVYVGGAHMLEGRAVFSIGADSEIHDLRYDIDLMDSIRNGMDKLPVDEMGTGNTSASTGIAIKEVLDAIVGNKGDAILDLSVFVGFEGRDGVYIGWPTQIRDLHARPNFYFQPLTDEDQNRFFEAYNKLDHTLAANSIPKITKYEPAIIGKIVGKQKERRLIPLRQFDDDVSIIVNSADGVLKWHISRPNQPEQMQIGAERTVTELAQGIYDGRKLVFAASRAKVIAFTPNGEHYAKWDNPGEDLPAGIHALAYDQSNGAIYWARSDGKVFRRGLGNHSLDEIAQIDDGIMCGALNKERNELVLGGKRLHLIDLETGKVQSVWNPVQNSRFVKIAVNDGIVYALNSSTHLYLFDEEHPGDSYKVANLSATTTGLAALENFVVVSTSSKGIRVFNTLAGELDETAPIENRTQSQFYGSLAPLEIDLKNYLAAAEGHGQGARASGDFSIHLFELGMQTGKPQLILTGAKNGIASMEVVYNAGANT